MKRIIWRAKICSPPSSDEQGDTGCALSLHWLCIPLAAYVSACHLPSSIGLHCTVWGHSSMTELPKALCCCVFITLGILEFVDVQMPSNRKGIQIGWAFLRGDVNWLSKNVYRNQLVLLKVLCYNAESLSLTKMKLFIQTTTSFYCLFWFESLVWWVNEGLWVQLSVVMRPLPQSFSLGHNKSATPAFGFSASPAVGSWRKLGGSAPSPLKCPSLWIREQELPSEGAVKRAQLLLAPTPLSHLPPSPCKTRLTPGTRDCRFVVPRYRAWVTQTRSP